MKKCIVLTNKAFGIGIYDQVLIKQKMKVQLSRLSNWQLHICVLSEFFIENIKILNSDSSMADDKKINPSQ